MKKIRKIRFHLQIEAEEYLKYYQLGAANVRVRADNGQLLVFPANRLQPYVTHDGIAGHFEMHFDENNKFVSLKRLSV